MELYILSPKYEILGVIDEAESVLWNKKYNDVGECEIYSPFTDELFSLLRRGNFIYRYDDDMFCEIQKIEITTDAEQGDYIIATGADICSRISGRIIRYPTVYSGSVAEFIKKILNENVVAPPNSYRVMSDLTLDEDSFSAFSSSKDVIEANALGDDVLELIISACKSYNYGFRVSYDMSIGKLVFRLYMGENKATTQSDKYIEFSPAFANILSTEYSEDESNYKNVVYIGYKNEVDTISLLSMYNGNTQPTGANRKEVYIDGTGQSREITYEELKQMYPGVTKSGTKYYITVDDEQIAVATSVTDESGEEQITMTNYTFLSVIRRLGRFELADRIIKQDFSGNVDTGETYKYKTDYNLGDIVKVVNEYGIAAAAQITEVMESEDTESGYVVEPKFEY